MLGDARFEYELAWYKSKKVTAVPKTNQEWKRLYYAWFADPKNENVPPNQRSTDPDEKALAVWIQNALRESGCQIKRCKEELGEAAYAALVAHYNAHKRPVGVNRKKRARAAEPSSSGASSPSTAVPTDEAEPAPAPAPPQRKRSRKAPMPEPPAPTRVFQESDSD